MSTNRIRMRHLRCFLAVARTGSVTRAAEELGTVQPSVSRTIRELEQDLGAVLFDRRGGGLELNSVGQTMYAHVAGGLAQIDHGVEATLQRQADRRLVIYVLPNVIRTLMPGAVKRFKAVAPDTELEIVTITSGLFADRMRRGDIDFAIGRLNAVDNMEGLRYEPLYQEPLAFFVRAGHPLAGRDDLTAADVDAYEVLLPTQGTIIRDEIDLFLISQGVKQFRTATITVSFEFSRAYMLISDAVACQPGGRSQARTGVG